MDVFAELKDDSYWMEISADKEFNDLQTDLLEKVKDAIDNLPDDKLHKLW